MAYNTEFIKELNGKAAPKGFHYMPNGKLMSDADHIAVHGYIRKTIKTFDINLIDIDCEGETRSFEITGDDGCYFSFKIYDNSNNYYDFNNGNWTSAVNGLNKIRLDQGKYTNSIKFNPQAAGLISYNIDLTAEIVGNCKTNHAGYQEFRNEDNSININKSTGSSSNLLRKVLYQDVEKVLYLSVVAPSLYATSEDTVNGTTSSSNRIVVDNTVSANGKEKQVGDLVTGTGATASEWTILTKIDPDGDNVKEIETSISNSISDAVTLTFTPPFNGITPHYTDSTSGRSIITTSSGAKFSSGFSITVTAGTGRTLTVNRVPTINDLCAITTVTFGDGLILEGEDTSSDTVFYRFPLTSTAGVSTLSSSMILDPSRTGGGLNTNTPAIISSYKTTQTRTKVLEGPYTTLIDEEIIDDVSVDGLVATGDIASIDRNGIKNRQAGNVIFSTQQLAALTGDTSKIYAIGPGNIETLTGMKVNLRDVEIEKTQVTTKTTAAATNSIQIALTDVGGISIGATVTGVGIDSSKNNPIVTKKDANTGASTIGINSSQTVESGQNLFFSPGVQAFTITGIIEVENMAINSTTLYFDIERFVTAQ